MRTSKRLAFWLDSRRLLVQVRSVHWEQAALVQLTAQGEGQVRMAPEAFLGFVYP